MSGELPPPIIVSTPPGTVTVKAAGWRVNVPIAFVAALLAAATTRLVSTERELGELRRYRDGVAEQIKQLANVCKPVKP